LPIVRDGELAQVEALAGRDPEWDVEEEVAEGKFS
jgi:hypothetical protein